MKRTAASKRATLPRVAEYTKVFLKDWEVMLLLIANDAPLGAEWKDHPLKGDWVGHRECHVGGDFLLPYRVDDESKVPLVFFVQAGTHADLFE